LAIVATRTFHLITCSFQRETSPRRGPYCSRSGRMTGHGRTFFRVPFFIRSYPVLPKREQKLYSYFLAAHLYSTSYSYVNSRAALNNVSHGMPATCPAVCGTSVEHGSSFTLTFWPANKSMAVEIVRMLSRLLKWIDTLNHMMTPIKTKITRNKAATSWINKWSRICGNHFSRFHGSLLSK